MHSPTTSDGSGLASDNTFQKEDTMATTTTTTKPIPDPIPDPVAPEDTEAAELDELRAAEARVAELQEKHGVSAAATGRKLAQVQALLRERVGYVNRGLDDRRDQVDAELKKRGYRVSAKTLEKDTTAAFTAIEPGVRVEDVVAEREARQTTR